MAHPGQSIGTVKLRNRRLGRWSWFAVTMLLGAYCGQGFDAAPPLPAQSHGLQRQEHSGLTLDQVPGLMPAFLGSNQAAEAVGFDWQSDREGLQARHSRQGYAVRLGQAGTVVTVGSEQLVLSPAQIACGEKLATASTASIGVLHSQIPHRAVYERGILSEWYDNGPLGLEQGFLLSQPPPGCEGGELLRVEMAVGGLRAEGAGTAAAFVNARGARVLQYTDLVARDAASKTLWSRLRTSEDGKKIVLEVDWAGAKFPLAIDPLISTQQQKLQPGDPASNDRFGWSVALSGDGNTALVSAIIKADSPLVNNGAVYVFVRADSNWTQQKKLQPADKASGDSFGISVALSLDGNTALVGARDKSDSPKSRNGDAYVFVRSGTTWSQQQKLQAVDMASDDGFGLSVALSGNGDTALIGTQAKSDSPLVNNGAAYVFVRTGSNWTPQQELRPIVKGTGDLFGYSVALSGDGNTALIGAVNKSDGLMKNGAAYVFVRSGSSWVEKQIIRAGDMASDDEFGGSVALSGDGNTALVGTISKSDIPFTDNGDAYVFVRSGSVWTQQQKLRPADPASGDEFGVSVALSGYGNTALVGAYKKSDSPLSANSDAYLFVRVGGVWTQQQKLQPADKASSDQFGHAVAMSGDGNTVLIGAFSKSDGAFSLNGDAYVFVQNGAVCTADIECSSGNCVDGNCCDTACGGGDLTDCQACSTKAGAPANGICSILPATAVCRSASGICDLAEFCTGAAPTCPRDSVAPASLACRSSTGPADPAEFCDGANVTCPPDGNNLGCACSLIGSRPNSMSAGSPLALALLALAAVRRRLRHPTTVCGALKSGST